jgi:tetratricopeptide (TPR) repeat protein
MLFVNTVRGCCLLIAITIGISGCSSVPPKPKVIDTQEAVTEKTLSAELTQSFADALTLLRDEKFQQSEVMLLNITSEYPDFAGPWSNLAIAQLSLEKYDDSLMSINKSLAVDEKFCPSLSLKGIILRELGRFSEAKAAYLSAIECNPEDMISLYNLGVLSDLYLHDDASALFYYERYLVALNETEGASKDSTVESWVVGLKRRVPEEQRIVRTIKKDKTEAEVTTPQQLAGEE